MVLPILPPALAPGDELRVVAPSRSLALINEATVRRARARVEALGYHLGFGAHVSELGLLGTANIEARLKDLHLAFAEPGSRSIITAIGGYDCVSLLDGLDWSLLANHPRLICGYSDCTVLLNAIYARTGMLTLLGPHFSTLGLFNRPDAYTERSLARALAGELNGHLEVSETWSDDQWNVADADRCFEQNPGLRGLNDGRANGRVVGGNLSSFCLLHGTRFAPELNGAVLFLEHEENRHPQGLQVFDRLLHATALQPGFEGLVGLVLGRFRAGARATPEALQRIICGISGLRGKPIAFGADFGHTLPMATIPIGAIANLEVSGGHARLSFNL